MIPESSNNDNKIGDGNIEEIPQHEEAEIKHDDTLLSEKNVTKKETFPTPTENLEKEKIETPKSDTTLKVDQEK